MNYVEIDEIKPAPYNPRRISEEKTKELAESIKVNGFLIPIIVNRKNKTIIAGHQRSKAAKLAGLKRIPARFVENVNIGDEIIFNQLHNGTDLDPVTGGEYTGEMVEGFSIASADDFHISEFNPEVVKEIARISIKYGNVLQCVCNKSGEILKGSNYVQAAKLLKIPVNLTISDIKDEKLFLDEYGEFYYDSLKKNTWVQGLAQLYRDDGEKCGKKKHRSVLYETDIIPYIDKNPWVHALDFGCGKGFYIEKLKCAVHIGCEFYPNNTTTVFTGKANKMIDGLINHLKTHGRFDVIVCDSVLNSVDSVEAERAVMGCLNAFLKPGGKVFFSGRTYEGKRITAFYKQSRRDKMRLPFFDKNHFSGIYRKGNWYYQKYHSKEEVEKLCSDFKFKIESHYHSGTWRICATKEKDIPIEQEKQAIKFEFNLPTPGGKCYNRDKETISGFLIALQKEGLQNG